jgi:hypothetical protein
MRGHRFLLRLMGVVAVGAAFFPMLGKSVNPVFQPLEKPALKTKPNEIAKFRWHSDRFRLFVGALHRDKDPAEIEEITTPESLKAIHAEVQAAT